MKLVHPPPNESLGESTDSRSFGRFNGAALILIRGHVYAVGFAEDPPVDSSDEAGRPTPQHAGALSHRMDGRDDSEAVAGPFAGGTRLEHPSICALVMSVCQVGRLLASACSRQTVPRRLHDFQCPI